ncbi:MAG TPA: hypothetical protein LFW21_07570 [Rickettsia endosymbiont of Pyrocoelia pectoralis]|nr:hypothetical protein [Rickettsia endosymbiont of Pyrocoelia pectoralis]
MFDIIYDKSLFNHPKLLKAAMEKFSLQQISKLSDKLDQNLVETVINHEDGDLIILGGLMSL